MPSKNPTEFAEYTKHLLSKVAVALGIPQTVITDGPFSTTTSCSDAEVFWKRVSRYAERITQIETEIFYIEIVLQTSGISGNTRRLARSLWTAEKCFEKSLAALAEHHRLGAWKRSPPDSGVIAN